MKSVRFLVIAGLLVMVFAWEFAPGVKAQRSSSTNLSAYEYLLGTSCTIDGEAGKGGVSFGGWIGGGGPVARGWTPFPGNKKGPPRFPVFPQYGMPMPENLPSARLRP